MLASASALADDIKIGFNSDMSATGSADFGISALAGARQAADEINAAGGVLGKKVVIVARDDVGAPPKAIQNTNELVDNEKVNAMLGGVNSGNMLAIDSDAGRLLDRFATYEPPTVSKWISPDEN
nr:ABC transporter substrate-binding protein [Bordetella holmesii]